MERHINNLQNIDSSMYQILYQIDDIEIHLTRAPESKNYCGFYKLQDLGIEICGFTTFSLKLFHMP